MSSGVLPPDDQPVATQLPEPEHTSVNVQKKTSPTRKPDRTSTVFLPASSLSTKTKLLVGLCIVLVIAGSWVGSTQTAKSTLTGGNNCKSPFFVVWFGTSWMLCVLPVVYVWFLIQLMYRTVRNGFQAPYPTSPQSKSCCGSCWKTWIFATKSFYRHSTQVFSPTGCSPLSFLSSTVLFTLIWVPTNYMYSRALLSIAPTDVTALFSTAPAFVFLFSIVILREPPLLLRFIAVLMAVGGIVLFAYEDRFASTNWIGIVLSLGSAIGAALYKTLLKLRLKDASLYQVSLFLTTIGLFTSLIFWPIILILHFTKLERLDDCNIPWDFLCISSALGVIFNFAINFGIAYTFPLFISLGTILGIPLNAVVDAVFRHVDLANWKLTAMDLIVAGFLIILMPPRDSLWVHRKIWTVVKCRCRRRHHIGWTIEEEEEEEEEGERNNESSGVSGDFTDGLYDSEATTDHYATDETQ